MYTYTHILSPSLSLYKKWSMYTFTTHVRCMCNVERGEEGCDHSSIHMLYHPVIPWLATLTPSNQVKAKQLIFGVGVAFGAAYNRVVMCKRNLWEQIHTDSRVPDAGKLNLCSIVLNAPNISEHMILLMAALLGIYIHIYVTITVYTVQYTHIYIYV